MDSILQIFSTYSSGVQGFYIPIMLIVAFISGVIASLSPCSLGMLPLVVGYVGGYSKESSKRLFIQMLAFSFGLSFVLSIIGVMCALTGKAFISSVSPVVLLIFSSIILILGLNLIGLIEINFPALVKKMPKNTGSSLFILPFLVGAVFAIAASPCSSPLLLSIMAFAAVSKNILFSVCLLFLFALGQCIIIILIAMFASALKQFSSFAKYSSILMKASGIILVLVSIYIYYVVFSSIN